MILRPTDLQVTANGIVSSETINNPCVMDEFESFNDCFFSPSTRMGESDDGILQVNPVDKTLEHNIAV